MARKLKVGVIGCGLIAIKTHIPIWIRNQNTELIAAADVDRKKLERVKSTFKLEHLFTDYRKMLEMDLDIVDICTPPYLHARMVLDSLEHEKNVLVEKPLALAKSECEEIINGERKSGKTVCVVQNHRYIPSIKKAKKLVEEGRIGNLISVSNRIQYNLPGSWSVSKWQYYDEFGGGVIYNIGSHSIDLLMWLGGDIKELYALGGDYLGTMKATNYVSVLMKFVDKGTAFFECTYLAGGFYNVLEVVGTGGILKTDVRNNYLIEIHGHYTPLEEARDFMNKNLRLLKSVIQKTYFKGYAYYHELFIQDFVRSILNGTSQPVTLDEARKTVTVLEAIKKSIETNEPVKIN